MDIKEYLIEKINELIHSSESKLSKNDIEKLVTLREKIKASKFKNDDITLQEIIKIIIHFFTHK
jgi:hypothetical protein